MCVMYSASFLLSEFYNTNKDKFDNMSQQGVLECLGPKINGLCLLTVFSILLITLNLKLITLKTYL